MAVTGQPRSYAVRFHVENWQTAPPRFAELPDAHRFAAHLLDNLRGTVAVHVTESNDRPTHRFRVGKLYKVT